MQTRNPNTGGAKIYDFMAILSAGISLAIRFICVCVPIRLAPNRGSRPHSHGSPPQLHHSPQEWLRREPPRLVRSHGQHRRIGVDAIEKITDADILIR